MAKKIPKKKRLIELTVQNAAQAYLKQYYKIKHNQSHIFSNIEERTKKEYGMKRADGLLAYKLNDKRAYVISMEAKSHKTLPALRPYRVNSIWVKDSIWKGFLFIIGTGIIFFIWKGDGAMQRLLLPLGAWVGAALVHLLAFQKSPKYQEMEVIHQVFQYPANEQWLSLSEDSFEMIAPSLRMNLFKICKARNIGVLMVDPSKSVHMVHPAVGHRKWGKDYLQYYLNEYSIRAFLKMKFTTPPASKKKPKKKKVLKSKWK
jgi:hypothetical protein